MEFHDKIMLPDLGRAAVMSSVKDAETKALEELIAERNTALDFYYNRNLDKHLAEWFPSDSLQQVPSFGLRIVPRFAKARMMLWKQPPKRFINGEEEQAEVYLESAYHLNSKCREFAEIAWLLGKCYMRSKYNSYKERIEYDIIPHVMEYLSPDGNVYGLSYEVGKDAHGDRQFVFWSEARDGEAGVHFKFDMSVRIKPVGDNIDLINPYNILPLSKVEFPSHSMDVSRAGLQVGIAMTEIALGTRMALGQPVITGIDQEIANLKSGINRVLVLPTGGSLNYVSPTGALLDMIEAVKLMINQTAQAHSLAIRWGDNSAPPSGEALRLMSVENLESRESDIPLFKEWELSRYEIDKTILNVHQGKVFGDSYSVDFAEAGFPSTWAEERNRLEFLIDNNLISRKELIKEFNNDITDEELEEKLGELQEEQQANQPEPEPAFEGLSRLGRIGT